MFIYFKIGKQKAIEFQLDFLEGEWFQFSLATRSKVDHPGITYKLSILKLFDFTIHFYDGRHWNHDKDRFYKEGEEMEEYNLRKQEEDEKD